MKPQSFYQRHLLCLILHWIWALYHTYRVTLYNAFLRIAPTWSSYHLRCSHIFCNNTHLDILHRNVKTPTTTVNTDTKYLRWQNDSAIKVCLPQAKLFILQHVTVFHNAVLCATRTPKDKLGGGWCHKNPNSMKSPKMCSLRSLNPSFTSFAGTFKVTWKATMLWPIYVHRRQSTLAPLSNDKNICDPSDAPLNLPPELYI